MDDNTFVYEELLKEFLKQPSKTSEPTYLELCRYPTGRFEETCTRLLCFYFDPNNEHGFQDLFLSSLLEIISNDKIVFHNHQIQVLREINSEGKRLDMLIKSPDMVIGIENKIHASVYNPLNKYSNQISLYGKKNVFKVLLSVRPISSEIEKRICSDNGFVIVTYTEFLERLKFNIGNYISKASQKYLVFIYDFIQTIENMTSNTYDDNKLSHFFSNNTEKIESMIGLYNKHNERVLKTQIEAIAEIKTLVKIRTEDDKWWDWKGWDLGYDKFQNTLGGRGIGIEASYEIMHHNPLGLFRIYITTWSLKEFEPYEDLLVELFPDAYLDKTKGNRVFLHMESIEDNDVEKIVSRLEYYYHVLKGVVLKGDS